MELVYKIINFIILIGALAFICHKLNLLDKIFGSRRRDISRQIEDAETAKTQAQELGADIEKAKQKNEERKQQLLKDAEEQAKADSAAIAVSGEEEAKGLLANAEKSEEQLMEQMKNRVSSQTVQRVAQITASVLSRGSFESSKQALNEKFIEQIKELVSAMPSDILNMNELKKLDISIKSAQPLSDEEMQKLTQIICETFISCHNEVDTDVIGGVRMQVGDTVYDGTLAHTLDRLSQDVESNTRQSDEQMKSIAEGIKSSLKRSTATLMFSRPARSSLWATVSAAYPDLPMSWQARCLSSRADSRAWYRTLRRTMSVSYCLDRSVTFRRATVSAVPAE